MLPKEALILRKYFSITAGCCRWYLHANISWPDDSFFIYKSTIVPLRLCLISFLFEIIFLTFLRSPKNTWPVMRTTQEQRQHLIFQSLSDMILTCLVIGNKILFILGGFFFLIQPIIKNIHNDFHLNFPNRICFFINNEISNSGRHIHMLYNLVRHNIEMLDIEIVSLDGKAYIWVTFDIVVKK